MSRLAVLLAALGCLVLAPAASAHPTSNLLSRVAGNGQFGSSQAGVHNDFVFDVTGPATPDSASPPSGRFDMSAATPSGTTGFGGTATCLTIDPIGVAAGMLFKADVAGPGNPPGFFGFLVHVLDPDDAGGGGTADRMDITKLNEKQYNRQAAQGCAPTFPRSKLVSGDITIQRGTRG